MVPSSSGRHAHCQGLASVHQLGISLQQPGMHPSDGPGGSHATDMLPASAEYEQSMLFKVGGDILRTIPPNSLNR